MNIWNNLERRGLIISQDDARTLEDFSHIIEKIQAFWGTPEFNTYFKSLTQIDGDRAGFSFSVLVELSDLYDLHALRFGINASPGADIWSENFAQ